MADPKRRKMGTARQIARPADPVLRMMWTSRARLVEEVLRGWDACGSTSSVEKSSGITVEGMCPFS